VFHKILAGIEFRTAAAITDHARKIKEKYKNEDRIMGHDDLFMRDFITLHPKSSEKIGCGISYFTIQDDEHWRNSRQFVLIRIDSSRAVFSHTKLRVTPETPKEYHRRRALGAMREAIVPQILDFKNEHFVPGRTRCPYTNEVIQDPHVDHEKPQTFLTLALEWMEFNHLQFEDIQVDADTDHMTYKVMGNKEQLASWCRYHSNHAKLRILSKHGNLGDARRE
jgi:hypothetical protein